MPASSLMRSTSFPSSLPYLAPNRFPANFDYFWIVCLTGLSVRLSVEFLIILYDQHPCICSVSPVNLLPFFTGSVFSFPTVSVSNRLDDMHLQLFLVSLEFID